MTITRNEAPKSVGIIFLEDRNNTYLPFDQFACSHLLLQMNRIQSIFDFQVITLDKNDGFQFSSDVFSVNNFDEQISKMVEGGKDKFGNIEYWIGITSKPIGKNYFFMAPERIGEFASLKGKVAIITSERWDRDFAPPSLFEYIAICLLTCSLFLLSYDLRPILTPHKTKGCIFDFARNKSQKRIAIANPILCVKCQSILTRMENNMNMQDAYRTRIIQQLQLILARKWMGDTETRDTPFFNLKKIYKYDVDRNSGYYKDWKEKFRDSVVDKLADWTLGNLLGGIIGGLIVVIFISVFGIKP